MQSETIEKINKYFEISKKLNIQGIKTYHSLSEIYKLNIKNLSISGAAGPDIHTDNPNCAKYCFKAESYHMHSEHYFEDVNVVGVIRNEIGGIADFISLGNYRAAYKNKSHQTGECSGLIILENAEVWLVSPPVVGVVFSETRNIMETAVQINGGSLPYEDKILNPTVFAIRQANSEIFTHTNLGTRDEIIDHNCVNSLFC